MMYFQNFKNYLNAWGAASGAASGALLGTALGAGAEAVVMAVLGAGADGGAEGEQGQETKGSQHFASESCAGKFDNVSGLIS